jgi:hypothetical protein
MKRNIYSLLVVIFLTTIMYGCSGVGPSPDYKTFDLQVKEELPKMVWLLQQQKREEFIREYASPKWVEENGGTDRVMLDFTQNKADVLLETLKRAEEMEPTIDSKNVLVTFDGPAFPRPLVFQKLIGKWRLLNS